MNKLMIMLICLLIGQTTMAEEATNPQRKLLKTFLSELVEITPGTGKFPAEFVMGSETGPNSERPAKTVKMNAPFAIARYEVPQDLYESVMGNNPSRWKGDRNSVEMISWDQANEFCLRLTSLLHQEELLGSQYEIRLPTEQEWEYCCRAGTTTAYSFGEEAQAEGDQNPIATRLDPYAWHTGNAAGNDPPVGALKPNPWGLYDMHGYLWEYTADNWRSDYQSEKEEPDQVSIRGGSWKDQFPELTSSSRKPFPQTGKDSAVGLRCVKAAVNKK